MRRIIYMIILFVCFSIIQACYDEKKPTIKADAAAVVTEKNTTNEENNVVQEVKINFEKCLNKNLVISFCYRDEKHSILYSDILKEYETRCMIYENIVDSEFYIHKELSILRGNLFNGDLTWLEINELNEMQEKMLNESKEMNGYYIFSDGDNEWFFVVNCNIVVLYENGKVTYYTLWDKNGEACPFDDAIINEDFSYLQNRNDMTDVVKNNIEKFLQRYLKIEYNFVDGVETIYFDDMFAQVEKVYEIIGNTMSDEFEIKYLESIFSKIFSFENTVWYADDEADITEYEERIKNGKYYKFYLDESESWLVSSDWHEAIYYGENTNDYYIICHKSERDISVDFKEQYDCWAVEGIYNNACIKVAVDGMDNSILDEELAKEIFEKYAKLYKTARADNIYGAIDMQLLDITCTEDVDLDGKEINDNHKVFLIGYAILPNVPEYYAQFYDYGEGIWADFFITADNFSIDKIDGIWYLTSVGLG